MHKINANPPRVISRIAAEEDLSARANREATISSATGYRPTLDYVTEKYGGKQEEKPIGTQLPNPSFAESLATQNNAETDEQAITAITDDLMGKYTETNPYAEFAQNLINKYSSLDELNKDWADIESQLMNDPNLL